jgi:hypothetical protein
MTATLLTPEARAAMLAAYPGTTNAELAKRYGLTERQLVYIASRAGVRKDVATLRATQLHGQPAANAQRMRLLDAIAQAGPDGLEWNAACDTLAGAAEKLVSTRLAQLVDVGQAHRAGPHRHARWFANAAWAAAYAARPAPPTAKALRSQAAQAAREARNRARAAAKRRPAATAGVRIAPSAGPARERGDGVVTAATRVTVGHAVPGPEARWHGNAAPIFSARRPGQYDDEPSSWVRAITGSRP